MSVHYKQVLKIKKSHKKFKFNDNKSSKILLKLLESTNPINCVISNIVDLCKFWLLVHYYSINIYTVFSSTLHSLTII